VLRLVFGTKAGVKFSFFGGGLKTLSLTTSLKKIVSLLEMRYSEVAGKRVIDCSEQNVEMLGFASERVGTLLIPCSGSKTDE